MAGYKSIWRLLAPLWHPPWSTAIPNFHSRCRWQSTNNSPTVSYPSNQVKSTNNDRELLNQSSRSFHFGVVPVG